MFAGALLVVLWAQICAQFVGMMGLKRLIGGGATMGEPAPIAMPGQIGADASAGRRRCRRPTLPMMGEAAAVAASSHGSPSPV